MSRRWLAWLAKKVPLTSEARERMRQHLKAVYAQTLAFGYVSLDVIPAGRSSSAVR
jgi:hypothetical protein